MTCSMSFRDRHSAQTCNRLRRSGAEAQGIGGMAKAMLNVESSRKVSHCAADGQAAEAGRFNDVGGRENLCVLGNLTVLGRLGPRRRRSLSHVLRV